MDLKDPQVQKDMSGGVDDVLYEYKCDGEVGYGFIESVVITG